MSRFDPGEEPGDLLLFTPVETAYRGANGWSAEVRRALIAALDRRDARWVAQGIDARMLLAEATGLLNGRDMCDASPDRRAVDRGG